MSVPVQICEITIIVYFLNSFLYIHYFSLIYDDEKDAIPIVLRIYTHIYFHSLFSILNLYVPHTHTHTYNSEKDDKNDDDDDYLEEGKKEIGIQ
jgi:hypothetical protein